MWRRRNGEHGESAKLLGSFHASQTTRRIDAPPDEDETRPNDQTTTAMTKLFHGKAQEEFQQILLFPSLFLLGTEEPKSMRFMFPSGSFGYRAQVARAFTPMAKGNALK